MDNLANQLRDDANQIDCRVSDELDRRIRATLESVKPVAPEKPRGETRHPAFWWASSLTGVVGAILVIVIINTVPQEPVPTATEPAPQGLVIPTIKWRAETAVLISPIEQEFENLESDLEKAEEAVRQDIERLF